MLFKNQKIATHTSKNITITLFVLIGTIGFYNWFVVPHRNYLHAAERYKSTAIEFTRKKQSLGNTVKIKQQELDQLQNKLEQAHIILFKPLEARRFLNDIQTVVENANCHISLLKFLPVESASRTNQSEKNDYITIQQVKLAVLGSYRNITLLMNKLQNRAEQVQIKAVTIKPNGKKPKQLKCDMTITIYVIKGKEIAANE